MQRGKRSAWIDIAKGIGIMLMIAGHTLSAGSVLHDAIFSFHMPLFFILAGWTFRVKPTKEVLAASARTLLVPYLLVHLTRLCVAWLNASAIDATMLRDELLSVTFSSGIKITSLDVPAVGLIWFLMALFWARILFNALEGVFQSHGMRHAWRLVLWTIVGVSGCVLGKLQLMLPFSFDVVLVACFFMEVGVQLKRVGTDRLFARWWVTALCLAAWIACVRLSDLAMADRIYQMVPIALAGAILGSYVTFAIAIGLERALPQRALMPLTWVGENSLLVLCIHALDRFVEWRPVPLLASMPGEALAISSLVRILVDLSISYMVWRTATRT